MSGSAGKLIASSSQTVGPFFHFGPGDHPELGSLVTSATVGTRIALQIRVFDGDDAPVPDAMIEIWQADGNGRFVLPPPGEARTGAFGSFGRRPTDGEGRCTFSTVRPGALANDDAAHVNLCVFMRGLLRHIYTRLYFAGDPGLALDRVLTLVPADRHGTLMAHPHPSAPDTWTFDIRLQGDRETVFFDL